MKQKRKLQRILFSFFILIVLIGFGYPSYVQNKFMYSYFKDLLNAVQQQNKSTVEQYYKDTKNILPEYWNQMFKYRMMGWKINSISGQPWPLDDDLEYKKAEISLFYEFKGQKLPKNGTIVNHPKYGKVVEVSTICRFIPEIHGYNKGTEISLMLPGQGISTNWLAPYEGK